MTIEYDGNTYKAGKGSRENLNEAITTANAGILTEIEWTKADGTPITLTAADLKNLAALIQPKKTAIIHKAKALEVQINAMTDPVEIAAFNVAAAWNA